MCRRWCGLFTLYDKVQFVTCVIAMVNYTLPDDKVQLDCHLTNCNFLLQLVMRQNAVLKKKTLVRTVFILGYHTSADDLRFFL